MRRLGAICPKTAPSSLIPYAPPFEEDARGQDRAPYYPIVYVRGYAMTRDEIVQTTSTPYMGFETGSTKIRQAQDGSVRKFVFESPLVRLMKDYDYRDAYASGAENADRLPARSIIIHRYYDGADRPSATAKVPSIPEAAAALGKPHPRAAR